MMDYTRFRTILNKHIIKNEKVELLRILSEKEFYLGKFSILKAKDVLSECLQHLLQSHEIRFGDAFEELIDEFLKEFGFKSLDKSIKSKDEEFLTLDQHFRKGKIIYFVEQKVRDDHDSTKKRGQVANFEAKLEVLYRKHKDSLVAAIYFIDPDLMKNKNYYTQEIQRLSSFYGIKIYLFYGKELFEFLGYPETWEQVLSWLKQWKDSLPEIPNINFDKESQRSFEEIKNLELRYWRKFLANDKLWDEEIVRAIFREGKILRLLEKFFSSQQGTPYKNLADLLNRRLKKYF